MLLLKAFFRKFFERHSRRVARSKEGDGAQKFNFLSEITSVVESFETSRDGFFTFKMLVCVNLNSLRYALGALDLNYLCYFLAFLLQLILSLVKSLFVDSVRRVCILLTQLIVSLVTATAALLTLLLILLLHLGIMRITTFALLVVARLLPNIVALLRVGHAKL